jgi:NDP-sugar pyrophosphorylase family protein
LIDSVGLKNRWKIKEEDTLEPFRIVVQIQKLTNNGELVAFKHTGFWKPMDALRDKLELEEMWKQNKAAWRKWG